MVISNGMRPTRAVYKTLSSVVYPIFLAKTKNIAGLEHLPTSGGFLLAANHVDWLDGFYIAAAVNHHRHRPVYFLTKTNNYWWTSLTIQIPTSNRGAIVSKAVDQLRAGRIVCNFPEGERNSSDQLMAGKTGTARMAMLAGVPVIPLGISCEPGRTMAQSLRYVLSSGHPVQLRVGRPIVLPNRIPEEITADELTAATKTIMSEIAPLAGKTL